MTVVTKKCYYSNFLQNLHNFLFLDHACSTHPGASEYLQYYIRNIKQEQVWQNEENPDNKIDICQMIIKQEGDETLIGNEFHHFLDWGNAGNAGLPLAADPLNDEKITGLFLF